MVEELTLLHVYSMTTNVLCIVQKFKIPLQYIQCTVGEGVNK